MVKKLISFVIIIVIAKVAMATYFITMMSNTYKGEDFTYLVKKGSSISDNLKNLEEKGMMQPVWLFSPVMSVYSKITDKPIFAGYYKIENGMTNANVLELLFRGGSLNQVKITIPEGLYTGEIAKIFADSLKLNPQKFIDYVQSPEFKEKHKINPEFKEGFLFPDTYYFFEDDSEVKCADKLARQMNTNLEQILKSKIKDKDYVLTLASIVQAESPNTDEYARIAGLYQNRLEIGMPLQADPTVQYAVGSRATLTRNLLAYDSPFNTYVYSGLPPHPINHPGRKAIEAAFTPEENNFLYMVAIGDGSGKHNFATNLQQHNLFVTLYKRNKKLYAKKN